ncbi:hypothetical protein I6B53_06500 [Schaalia sp. 19OD2882]|uniref:hypothetical protein n=1 Tax=Schaalia sp. 19OD2882 TaxID=2794089 RepID=UPI001C1EA007|nr:hypothetical protein [Schaalia sp. 19OD2882]QWW18806.1 hypothetical protein I6B53_06500 [Schaalia sp. 19OD2882]
MRIRTAALLGAAGLAAVVWATGFPSRVGLTRSQAAISLPGDLVVPMADVIVDRAILVDAPPALVWRALERAFAHVERETVLYEEAGDCLVLAAALPGLDDEDERPSSCALALLPEANERTRIHLRERHLSTQDMPAWLIKAALAVEAPAAMLMLRDIKAAAEAL